LLRQRTACRQTLRPWPRRPSTLRRRQGNTGRVARRPLRA
jgi:hypothetical protein